MGIVENMADITVIMTLYKRPEMLLPQLEAIRKQTLRPKKILLFQDRMVRDYEIKVMQNISEQFDSTYITNSNEGVWGRFRYARNADTKYVCIFDDDTIPEKKWLESCFNESQKQRGIYGTIGIVLRNRTGYPYWQGYYRVGWANPNEVTEEVDFVGHSWFLETEWLDYMFNGTEIFQKYHIAGEDMCLSAKAQEQGIKTFVPPHPVRNKDLWGSTPDIAGWIGDSKSAISASEENLRIMNEAVIKLQDTGWKPLFKKNKDLVERGFRDFKWRLKKERIKKIINSIHG